MHLVLLLSYWDGEVRRIVLFFHITLFAILLPSVPGKGHWPVQMAETRDVYKARQVNWKTHQHNVLVQRLTHLASENVQVLLSPGVTSQFVLSCVADANRRRTHFRKYFFVGRGMTYGNTKYLWVICLLQSDFSWNLTQLVCRGWCEWLFIKMDFLFTFGKKKRKIKCEIK